MGFPSIAVYGCLLIACQFVTDVPGEQRGKKEPPSEVEIVRIEHAFVKKEKLYYAASRSMPTEVAAKGWLNLLQEGHDIPKRRWIGGMGGGMGFGPGSAVSIFGVIPNPDVWPEIERQIEKRPESDTKKALQALFARISGNERELSHVENNAPKLFGASEAGGIAASEDPDPHSAIFLDLLRRGRVDELVKDIGDWHEIPEIPGAESGFRDDPAILSELYLPLKELAIRCSDEKVWIDFVHAALFAGHAEEGARRIEMVLADPHVSQENKDYLGVYLPWLEGVSGDVGRVRQDLRKLHGPLPSWVPEVSDESLLGFGLATDDPSAIEEGIRDGFAHKLDFNQAAALFAAARYRPPNEALEYAKTFSGDFESYKDFAQSQMCAVYRKENQPQRILELLGNNDSPIIADPFEDREKAPTAGYYLAWAYAQTGRHLLAIQILHYVLSRADTCAPAYDLLSQLQGAGALPLYRDLARLDPISPFPLLGQANLMVRLGRMREAESLLRTAIALDPVDRLSLPEHRFIAYRLLAQILRKRHALREADANDRIADSARYAEEGDRYFAINLAPQAMAAYQMALKLNPGNYLTEEQLALCTERLGHWRQALPLYRHAFEMFAAKTGATTYGEAMSDHMFDEPDLTAIGTRTFTEMEFAGKGTVGSAYGLGRLYGFHNPGLALRWYEKAVTRDPNCLAAWIAISMLDRSIKLSSALAKQTCLRILALSPVMQGPTPYPCYDSISDLRPMFRSVQRMQSAYPTVSANPLPQHIPTYDASSPEPVPWLSRPYGTSCPIGAYFIPAPGLMKLLTTIDDAMGTSIYSNVP